MRRDQRDLLGPRHHDIHLVEEDLLAGLLEKWAKAECGLFHDSNLAPCSLTAPVGVTRGFADLP